MGKEFLNRTNIFPEIEKKQSAGIAMAIVGIDPSKNGENVSNPALWTNIERKPKPETDRLVGQISFPSDTRKIGESRLSNILGTLAEFTENDNLIKLLSFMPSSFANRAIQVKENYYDLAVVFLDGFPTTPIVPLDRDEVTASGWMKLDELKKMQKENPSHLRSFVRQIIEKGFISNVIGDYFRYPQQRLPFSTLVDSNFSIRSFYEQREKLTDVVGNSGVIFELRK